MPTELAPKYDPTAVESQIAQRWTDANAFHAEPSDHGDPYCIVIPPPNVTAALHMGHALNNTLQDILIRWRRMVGDNTVWIPGTDHAGIATQTVVEKRVLKEEGKKRTDFERDVFIAKIQAWKDEYEATITNQLKTMGCSCDWERQRFTMDPICARAVREAFFRLFKDGLIYRGKRLVNWDPATQTALADDEVDMKEVDGHFYYLRYPLTAPLPDGTNYVTVATTRPETMLGDTAVAINPKDPRANDLRGRHVILPIVNRIIPIIEDDYVVLPVEHGGDPTDAKAQFATGFLKVTPAHDPNDYEIGQRHKLPIINVLAPDGTISKTHGWPEIEWSDQWVEQPDVAGPNDAGFVLGKDRFAARKLIVTFFKERDMLEAMKPYKHSVGHSYRSHVPIEPYLSDQWYVKVTDDRLAGAALRAMAPEQRTQREPGGHPPRPAGGAGVAESAGVVDDPARGEGQLRFHPERYAKTFEQWHLNIRDWCISRQLWWGHRIPIWTYPGDLKFSSPIEAINHAKAMQRLEKQIELWTIAGRISYVRSPPHASIEANFTVDQRRCMDVWHLCVRDSEDTDIIRAIESTGFVQDPDVLDTWFSSALWPFSTLGWPDNTPELQKWNPGNVLCTAREIITLWVSRMVMMNHYLLGRLPFTDVFVHAMIQDGEGRKMSKSLGNGVDPLDIIHSHGSDAMRFTLASMTTNTQDVRMPVLKDPASGRNTSDKFDYGRNFSNKLWNAVRFALSNLAAVDPTHATSAPLPTDSALTLPDKWILSRLARAVRVADANLAAYEFGAYAQGLYDFIWRDLCDWYIEAIKPVVNKPEGQVQRRVLALCIDAGLRLLHPAMPFITEKLWEALNDAAPIREVSGVELTPSALLIHASWPKVSEGLIDAAAEAEFEFVQRVVGTIREVRTTYKVPPRQKVNCSARCAGPVAARLLALEPFIETFANLELHEIGPKVEKAADAAATVVGDIEVYLHGLVESDAEKARLTKRAEELNRSIAALNGRLANPAYTDKAPAKLVQQTREQLAAAERELATVNDQVKALG